MIFAKFFTSKSTQPNQCPKQQNQPPNQSIPEDIASLIMDLQIQCDGQHICQQFIVSLINLYTDAIEHYELIDAYKSEIYKKRLQIFLSKSSVLSALHGKDSILISKKSIVERATKEATVNSKEIANRLIDRHEKRIDFNKKIIETDIRNQKQNLQTRIERRRSMSNKSISSQNQNKNTSNIKVNKNKIETNLFLNVKQTKMRRVFI